VHSAEHDRFGFCRRGVLGELEGVAHVVGDVLDPGHLIVVGQDDRTPFSGERADLPRPFVIRLHPSPRGRGPAKVRSG
jgi:hypothetical protein